MYEHIFKIGFRLPVPSLVCKFLNPYEIAPNQLMPNAWRVLLSCEILVERQGICFGLNELLNCYYVKEHEKETGRYTLVLRPRKEPLVAQLPLYECYWNTNYFFVSSEAMFGNDPEIPRIWSRTGRLGVEHSIVGLNTAERMSG